jgi:rhamnogalacturonyl hydrolase YesR
MTMPPRPELRIEALDDAGRLLGSAEIRGEDERDTVDAGPFRVDVLVKPGNAGTSDVTLDVVNRGTEPFTGHLRLAVGLSDAPDPWWLIPGLFYGENRPEGCERRFPRFAVGANDPAGMVSDHWSFRADRAATPAVFAWGAEAGVVILTSETSECGLTGVGFAHSGATATAHVTFPFREDPVTYYGSADPRPSETGRYVWKPDQPVRLGASFGRIGADRHGYAPVLREVYEQGRQLYPVWPWMPVAEAADIAAEGLVRWHYDPDPGVLLETVGFDREVSGQDGLRVDRQAMHVGWVSGIPWAYALLTHSRRGSVINDAQRAAAEKVIDFICANRSPSGTFWGTWYRSKGWSQSWTPLKGGLHARTLGEATLFLVRALELGDDVRTAHPAWVSAARANLDVIRDRQRVDGNLGSVHHAEDGRVLSWEGASGLTWVAALAEAERFDDDDYLATAVSAGEYYAQFVDREFIHGAPEDVDLAPTSEDGYAAVMAYAALYRRTGEGRWLDLARRAADWMLTFRYTYNVAFSERSMLGAYRFASRGADQASPSNQHLHAYGLICIKELIELSEASGDPHYRERAEEALACFRQLVAREDGEVNSYRGMITERYYQTECFQPKGMLLTLSHAWSVGVLLLGCEQMLAASPS